MKKLVLINPIETQLGLKDFSNFTIFVKKIKEELIGHHDMPIGFISSQEIKLKNYINRFTRVGGFEYKNKSKNMTLSGGLDSIHVFVDKVCDLFHYNDGKIYDHVLGLVTYSEDEIFIINEILKIGNTVTSQKKEIDNIEFYILEINFKKFERIGFAGISQSY
jgi:hypothetical protein